ncbi:30S ribosomal protein THX [Ekhidna sp.]
MGKGDNKTRRGKISKGTYGTSRPRSANKKTNTKSVKKAAKKKN